MMQVVAEVPEGVHAQVLRVEVCALVIEVIGQNAGGRIVRAHRQAVLQDKGFLDLRCELAEGFLHVGEVAVDVEVVGIHRRDDGDIRVQLEETPVEFVCLRHHHVVLAHQQVGAVVLGDAAEEGIAAFAAFGEDVGHEGGCGGLAVGAGYRQAGLPGGDLAQHAAALDNAVAVFLHELQFLKAFRDSGGVDHEGFLHVLGDAVDVVFVMHGNPFLLQLMGEVGGSAVVAAHAVALEFVVTGYGAHPYAAYSYEVYVLPGHVTPVCIFLLRWSLLR